jgi:hypothetical protein
MLEINISFPDLNLWDIEIEIDESEVKQKPSPHITELPVLSYCGTEWGLVDIGKAMNDEQKAYALNVVNEYLNTQSVIDRLQQYNSDCWDNLKTNGNY